MRSKLAGGVLAAVASIRGVACAPDGGSSTTDAQEALAIDPDVTIGVVEGDPNYLFGDIWTVAVDEAGFIYVGDRIGATVRVYDGSGRFVKQIAREGEGPGEIAGWPADITTGPDGTIYIRDDSRITVFTSAAGTGNVADSVAAIWSLEGYGNLAPTRSRVGDTGEYYYPDYIFRRDEHPRFFYIPFRDGARMADTLEVPPYPMLTGRRQASYRVSAGSGRLLDGLSYVPFAPVPVWDVTHAGTILSSSGAEYALIETGMNGDTLRVIRGPTAEPAHIPAAEREDSARALAARLDSLPVPIDQVMGLGPGVRDRRLPVTLPPIIGIHVATDGAIWVERWPTEGQSESRFYDVFDHDGELRRRVVLRAPLTREPPPFFGANYVTGVIREADTDVDRVVRFTLSVEPVPADPPM